MSRGDGVIVASSLGSFLAVVNTTSLLIAIPTILVDLHTNFLVVLWIIIAYSIALTVLSPVFGKYSDMVGRKKMYVTGYLVFFVGSLAAGLSPTAYFLVAARIVQGIAAALLFSNSLAILTDTFRSVDLQRAIGINTAVVGLGMAIGPLVGGLLTEITWRAIFYFNAPLALAGYFVAARSIEPISKESSGHGFDSHGAIVFSVFLVSTVISLTLGPFLGWSSIITEVLIALAFVSLAAFVVVERRSGDPMLDPGMFRNRRFSGAIFSSLLNAVSRSLLIFILILYLQGPVGFTPLYSGLLMTPYAAFMGVTSFYSSRLMKRFSEQALQSAGLLLITAASFLLAATASHYDYLVLGVLMSVAGAGIGLFSTPNSAVIMTSVNPGERGVAASKRTLFMNMGSVSGMTLVFTILASYVPVSVIGAVFLGTVTGAGRVSTDGFVTGLAASYVLAGLSSLVPLMLVAFSRSRRKSSRVSEAA